MKGVRSSQYGVEARLVATDNSGNGCLLNLLADAVANTPGQAGCYVRGKIELRLRRRQEMTAQDKDLKDLLQKLKAENEEIRMRLSLSAKKMPGWVLLAIGVFVGAALLWLVR